MTDYPAIDLEKATELMISMSAKEQGLYVYKLQSRLAEADALIEVLKEALVFYSWENNGKRASEELAKIQAYKKGNNDKNN